MNETHETIRYACAFTLATIARVCACASRVCKRVSCACAVHACMMRIRTQARVPVPAYTTWERS